MNSKAVVKQPFFLLQKFGRKEDTMAKSNIEIEITANLKDNATDKAKTVRN